ncbi:gamma-D-glutamyl-L-lysine endopeptidase [Weizmannia acidilactici]|uniref:Gamma-D-glutamyl-L-lysine endopeptidase n=1 Tax=Weizmannia acidilactici TaxID=2607726 RepID=A0A5J4J4S3_9BACI|nr:C40 family peptidase [Weizmannia acidilactici]GER69982.1 gamma-D-glutamyl-L-lysine endopeptidase [Weizmannia acidilactici]
MDARQVYLISTAVATLWTSKQSPDEWDAEALQNPANMKKWLRNLTVEQRLEFWRKNKIQTQALYGQKAVVHQIEGEWAYVSIPEQSSVKHLDGYPGWMPLRQLKRAEGPLAGSGFAAVNKPTSPLYDENQMPVFEASFQTCLPVMDENTSWVKVRTVSGTGFFKKSDVQFGGSSPGQQNRHILKAGKMFLGLPYLWGGMSGFGYDCSGFSYTMVRAATGMIIPRDACEQAESGEDVPLERITPGDLLFFAHEEGKGAIHHVGIYAGDGKLLHSPKTGKSVELLALEGTIYEKELCRARRYWK